MSHPSFHRLLAAMLVAGAVAAPAVIAQSRRPPIATAREILNYMGEVARVHLEYLEKKK